MLVTTTRQVSDRLYFIEQGLVCGYYLKESREVTSWFMREGDFIISIVGFFTRRPAREFIELLEDSTVWSIHFDQLQQLYRDFSEFNIVGRQITKTYYVLSEERSPLEMTVNSIIGSLPVYTLPGLSAEAGVMYTLFTALGEFFYHTNVKTPQWVGYIFQRSEMHRIHHEYEKHPSNYGDIVWWDMLFGTCKNSKEFTSSCSFDEEKELLPGNMLRFRDVRK